MKQAKRKDYYKVLGAGHQDDDAQLKRHYKKAALIWHPDKWAHSTEEEKTIAESRFKEVGEAGEAPPYDRRPRRRVGSAVEIAPKTCDRPNIEFEV